MIKDTPEAKKPKETKFCPRCALENIKTKLKRLPNDILRCGKCKWLGKYIGDKLTEPFTCPRCALEGIKSNLKNYPNHLLVCRKCQFVGRLVGSTILQQ